MYDILSMGLDELSDALGAIGEKPYRAKQIFLHLHGKKAVSFDEMTDLSKDLRHKLPQLFALYDTKVLKIQKSLKDNTQKYLLEPAENTIIESVLMNYSYGDTICISSQDGCKMGCVFCASGLNGFTRDLSPGEMLSQVYAVERESQRRVSRCVIMGQGEPFDNFDNTMKFISLINQKYGHGMGARNITVSTCGIVPKIKVFADLNNQVNLSVSLHAPNDDVRRKLMKISGTYGYGELMSVCNYYTKTTNRRITFEYALIKGINDTAAQAKELSSKLKGMLCHVNLIPLNETGNEYKKSKNSAAFLNVLTKNGVSATIRRELGSDIDAACGQLRNRR